MNDDTTDDFLALAGTSRLFGWLLLICSVFLLGAAWGMIEMLSYLCEQIP